MNDENIYAPPLAELEVPGEISGEHILASRWARLWGSLIDGIIAMVFIFPTMFLTGYWEKAMAGNVPFFDTILLAAFGNLMFVVLHGYLLAKHGQTIGKRLVGTRIVSVSSNKILPFWKVFLVRYLPVSVAANIPLISQFLVIIDALFIFRKSKRCAHDLIAGTKVIKVSAH